MMVKKACYGAMLFCILALAFFLRSKMILNGDFYYLLDQSRDLLLTKSIVIDHKLTLIGARTGLGGLFHGALWIYLIVPFFFFAKGNPFFTLAPLFEFVSLSLIVVGFFVGGKLYGRSMGLLFALFLTLSSVLVETVPFTSNAQVLPIVFLLYLFSIIQWMRGNDRYIIASLFCIGLGFQFESAFAILLLPLTLLAVVLKSKLPSFTNALLSIGAFLLAVSTFIFFDLRHQFLMTTSIFKLFSNHVKPLPGYEQYANLGFRFHDRLINFWSSLFTPLFSSNNVNNFLLITILVVGICLFIWETVQTWKLSQQNREYFFILLSPFIIFGAYVFYPLPLWPHYLLPIVILAVFILSLSIQTIWKYTFCKLLIGVFLFIAILPTFVWLKENYITTQPYAPMSDGSYKNQLAVAKWVQGDSYHRKSGYFVYTTGILTYNMDYLVWWLGTTDTHTQMTNTKEPTTYLILYPHLSGDQNAYAYWKKHVLHTNGKTLRSKAFSGGLIVEKLRIAKGEQEPDPNYYQNLLFR